MHLTAVLRDDRIRGWALLVAVQAVVSLALFHEFMGGGKFFAYLDVGADTYALFVPQLIHYASASNWASAWSFNIGLGGIAPLIPSPFTLLGIAGGPEHVLEMRIWVYLAKIFVGGTAFYGFAFSIAARREIAVIVGVAYSFCGYIATDGQWDTPATEFATYPVILWALARHARSPSAWPIPLSIAFAAYCGVFMFSVGVFIAYVFLAACIASDRPLATARTWLTSVLPLCAIGFTISAPVLLPTIFQLAASSRVTGLQADFLERLSGLFSLNDTTTVLVELAGFFHKNMLGVGNRHFGWMNYLESPGFYVGLLPLLVIPQLWRGTGGDRRVLVATGVALALFFLIPAIRSIAFGFGLDYFRTNNLWVSMLLLALFAKALEVIARQGVDRLILGGTVLVLAYMVWQLQTGLYPRPSLEHEIRLAAFVAAELALLAFLASHRAKWPQFAVGALVLVAVEATVVNQPSYFSKRQIVTRETPGYYNDGTVEALAFLKARDPGFHRIEKAYDSVSFCDAIPQNYMGVKSYWFQSTGAVGFFLDLELLPKKSRIKNYTNWLPNFGERFALNSVAGVKYAIAKRPLDWPGFRKIHEIGGLSVYENDLALPLGVVHTQQYPREQLLRLPVGIRDLVMVNAVIVDQPRGGGSPPLFDSRQFTPETSGSLDEKYFQPARLLQTRGLTVERFTPGHIVGRVQSDLPGILVFSIPFARGWSLAVDGISQPLFNAHLGMLATDIGAGPHRIELRYTLPGFMPGLLISLAGLIAWPIVVLAGRRKSELA